MPRTTTSLIALGFSLTLALPALAEDDTPAAAPDDLRILETLTVIGTAGGKHNVGGSIDYIDAEALDVQGHSDILRVLRAVPGVNIQEEEGYGLRPNIGLRGSGSDRNSRIMIMEDGIPIAPAAYASPSAYYFPSTARINAVEVTKGPAVIQYGPRTTGGAIHLFSTPIPFETEGKAEILWGDYGRQRLHAWMGTRQAISNGLDFGILIETYQDEADGFLERDTGGPNTGFDVSDYVIKTGLYADAAAMPWSLELKFQTKDETSNQTYLGLTEADFAANPLRLYDAAQNDQMNNENELFQLTGKIDLNADTTLTSIAYSNEVGRNWYKLQGVNAAGGGASGDVNISTVLRDPITYSAELDLLRGTTSLADSLIVRANNRKYYSRGVSFNLDTALDFGGLTHNFNAGLRLHEDQEDRFQKEDAYRLLGGTLDLTSGGAAGGTTNRVTDAEAVSLFVLDRVEFTDRFQITAGLRFEDYQVTRYDFSTADPTRAAGPTRTRSNSNDVILPSLSMVFNLNDEIDLIGGVHKGFSPAGASAADNEESWQYELGARFSRGEISLEAVAFYNDYSNLLGECTLSSGGDCPPGEAFNGDAVIVTGLEITGAWDAAEALGIGAFSVPLSAAYSYTDSEFQTTFVSAFFSDFTTNAAGEVRAGDELIYVPAHQLTLSAGFVADRWGSNFLFNYVSEARGFFGQGDIPDDEAIEARTLVDLSAWYELADGIRLKAKIENLFDESYLAARRPAGLRPGKPQEVLFGFEVKF